MSISKTRRQATNVALVALAFLLWRLFQNRGRWGNTIIGRSDDKPEEGSIFGVSYEPGKFEWDEVPPGNYVQIERDLPVVLFTSNSATNTVSRKNDILKAGTWIRTTGADLTPLPGEMVQFDYVYSYDFDTTGIDRWVIDRVRFEVPQSEILHWSDNSLRVVV